MTLAEIERELAWRYEALRELRRAVEGHERAVAALQRERKEYRSDRDAAGAAREGAA